LTVGVPVLVSIVELAIDDRERPVGRTPVVVAQVPAVATVRVLDAYAPMIKIGLVNEAGAMPVTVML
jgi:hypothetical protein